MRAITRYILTKIIYQTQFATRKDYNLRQGVRRGRKICTVRQGKEYKSDVIDFMNAALLLIHRSDPENRRGLGSFFSRVCWTVLRCHWLDSTYWQSPYSWPLLSASIFTVMFAVASSNNPTPRHYSSSFIYTWLQTFGQPSCVTLSRLFAICFRAFKDTKKTFLAAVFCISKLHICSGLQEFLTLSIVRYSTEHNVLETGSLSAPWWEGGRHVLQPVIEVIFL
jgi:hypothetical protein